MRIDVEKCLVIGPRSRKKRFFSEIQKLGVVEFIGKTPPLSEAPLEVQNLTAALHILRHMVPVKQAHGTDYRSAGALAAAAIESNERYERLNEQQRIIQREIARIEPFGEFSVSVLRDVEMKTGLCFQFFFSKEEADGDSLIFISNHLGLNYYISIAKEKQSFEGLTELIIEQSVSELRAELAEVNREIYMIEIELSALAHQKKLLKKGLVEALNLYHLEIASSTADEIIDDKIFVAEGWIPKNKLLLVQEVADRLHLMVERVAAGEGERIPTYLENKGAGRLGEDLVDIYDTPSTQDRDPSWWVFFSFATFFSMIVADAGYGLLILGLSLWLYWKFGKKGGAITRVIKLALFLSIGCIFWGVMLSSFFGIPVSPDNPVRKVSVIDWMVKRKAEYLVETKNATYQELVSTYPELAGVNDPHAFLMTVKKQTDMGEKFAVYDTFTDNILIEIAIFIGVVHLILSLMRYLDRYWAALGWIIALVGGYLFFPSLLKSTSLIYFVFNIPEGKSAQIGLYMLYGGAGLAIVLSLIQKRLAGLAEAMNVIQLFADVMSYLRIYALSLAGMIMGTTFNHIGASMPIYIGWLVILAGHTINFTLAMMGGLIHGLRLNFIEWYHYSFEGGGRKFKPLSLLKLD